jgi:hypothetical protein
MVVMLPGCQALLLMELSMKMATRLLRLGAAVGNKTGLVKVHTTCLLVYY